MNNLICEFCGKEFPINYNIGIFKMHMKGCRTRKENEKYHKEIRKLYLENKIPIYKIRSLGFKQKDIRLALQNFDTIKISLQNRPNCNDINNIDIKNICEFCGKNNFKNNNGYKIHILSCKITNTNKQNYEKIRKLYFDELFSKRKIRELGYRLLDINLAIKNIKRTKYPPLSLEHRKKISVYRKNQIKNFGWIWNINKKESYPERRIRQQILEPYFSNQYEIIAQYTHKNFIEHFYRIDFAFINEKIAIEVNGSQHYKNGVKIFTEYHINRENYIKDHGWKVVNIPVADINFNVSEVKKFLFEYFGKENKENINLDLYKPIRMQREIIKEQRELHYQKFKLVNCLKRTLLKKRNIEICEQIKDLDFTKRGTLQKIAKQYNISHTSIKRLYLKYLKKPWQSAKKY